MKKILIIYEPKTHIGLISRLLDNMKSEGLDIDAFNLRYQFFHSKRKMPLLVRLLSFMPKNRITIFLLRNIFYILILKTVQKEYDILDIHFFSRPYVRFLKICKKPYKLTIWGSDFYRETPQWQEKKRDIYKNASVIQVETVTVKNDLVKYEPSLENKVMVCNFGIDVLDYIEKVKVEESTTPLLLNDKNKIIVTCGYNGSEAQQHLKIFKQIGELNKKIRDNLLLCVPITYGLSSSYEDKIVKAINNLDVEYILLKERLDEKKIAKLRIETDIVINMQTTDSLSSSLLEHLYSGNILLLGKWLPTETYDNYGIYYHTISENTLSQELIYVMDNLEVEKNKCKENYQRIKSFATWESVKIRQYELYRYFLL